MAVIYIADLPGRLCRIYLAKNGLEGKSIPAVNVLFARLAANYLMNNDTCILVFLFFFCSIMPSHARAIKAQLKKI